MNVSGAHSIKSFSSLSFTRLTGMIIIRHRINTIEELIKTPKEYGIEADIRPWNGRLILHHEPHQQGEDLEEYLKSFSHAFFIANIKSEGIEKEVIKLLTKYGIKNYFLLDVTFPFMIKLSNEGMRDLAVRFSEYESLDTCMFMKDRAKWVFIDVYTQFPLKQVSYKKLSSLFKLCLVSPELLARPEDIKNYQELMNKQGMRIDAVLTKRPEDWKSF